MSRIIHLRKALPERAAGLVVSPVGRRYCTGFASSDGYLLLCREAALFLTDSRYIEAARQTIAGLPVEELADAPKQLRAFCKAHGVRRLFLEHGFATLEQFARLRRWLPGVYIERGPLLTQALHGLRAVKSTEEIANIRAAQAIAEAALAHALSLPLVGMSERELALALDFYMLRHGAQSLAFETIAVAGENGANPHGVPGSRAIRPGDLITMDFGCVVNGLHSDMTRTVAAGAISDEQQRIYEIVLRAQRAALERLGPGVACRDIDAAARDVIKAAGYDAYFRHGTGHGVGYEIHEAPVLSPKSNEILRPGMVVTVEPGIYVPGFCGVRIEDMVLITEKGYENLTAAGKDVCLI
ncbi:MAG: aminopeptidase P family protein [Oscillospiraceae bacterium]|nr:aminopeptidase P family protein [Oscillospiraceae bacterium]